jgi:hypothetical protein
MRFLVTQILGENMTRAILAFSEKLQGAEKCVVRNGKKINRYEQIMTVDISVHVYYTVFPLRKLNASSVKIASGCFKSGGMKLRW